MAHRVEALADLLYDLSHRVSGLWRQVFRELDLTPATLLILRQVMKEPGLTVSEVARRTGVAKSHVSRAVESLRRRGYVEKRTDSADGRLLRVYPTPGLAELAPLRHEVRRRLAQRLQPVPEGQLEALIEGLEFLRDLLGAPGPDPVPDPVPDPQAPPPRTQPSEDRK